MRYRTTTPIVVIGSGAAGLSTALALAPQPVLLLTKTDELWSGSTPLAQGGLAGALGEDDTAEAHASDTLTAGAGLSDAEAVHLLTRAAPEELDRLIEAGFAADRDQHGQITLGREGGHGANRILHAGGDQSGRALALTLLDQVQRCPSIEVMTGAFVWSVLQVPSGQATGVTLRDAGGRWWSIPAAAVVVATGGIGQLFDITTNPAESTGDGLALAARAGAVLRDVEFVQFHPTGLKLPPGQSRLQSPLVSEALRGAGALLVDQHGHRFMTDRHPMAELAPRDVVTAGIVAVQHSGGQAFLDLRPVAQTHGEQAFPQAFNGAREAGYDPLAAPVPIGPTAHFHMGGIETDLSGRSSVAGLYAVGEVAATGLHGANRLASNSLTEALVMGRQVAKTLRQDGMTGRKGQLEHHPVASPFGSAAGAQPIASLRQQIKGLASETLGPLRDSNGLKRAITGFGSLGLTAEDLPDTAETLELRNLALIGRIIAAAALLREESRGAHRRTDFPDTDPDQASSRQLIWPAALQDLADDLPTRPAAAYTKDFA